MAMGRVLGNSVEKLVAGRWIAGASIDDAVLRTEGLNALGMGAVVNYLGEEFRDRRDVDEAVATYLRLINKIARERAVASIAVKPTQIGLRIGRSVAAGNYSKILNAARRSGIFVWLDMEGPDTVDATLRLYVRQAARKGVGVALQSNLRRSMDDAKRIVGDNGVLRLVKGAYPVPQKQGIRDRKEVARNYSRIMNYLFRNSGEFTIGTHDESLIREALELNRSYRREVTYAMLSGIRSKYAEQLAASGNNVAIYVPFGSRWVDYASRRMREQGHAALILRSMLGG